MKKYFLLLIALVFALQTLKAQTVQYLPLYTDNDFAARTLNAKLPVGTTAGALDVSASGGAAYSIPIALPPGTKGVVPSVAVGYNSQGGNGIMGMGWNLSAASAITRTGKNFKYDGVVTPINNNYLDYFTLDGNRLEVTSSNYGQEGSTYATKMETFAKITYVGNGFTVEAKNGMVYEYGKVENAQFNAQNSNTTIAWYLNKASDQYGNYIIYEYEEIEREVRLKEIRYTGNDAEGIAPYNKVKFNYSERLDKKTMYSISETVKSNALLSEIVVATEGEQQVKKYQFSYGQDEFKHSFLREVFEYGSIKGQAALNSTIFKYKTATYTMTNTVVSTLPRGYDIVGTGDYNGDGLTDMMAVSYHLGAGSLIPREINTVTTFLKNSNGIGYTEVTVNSFPANTNASFFYTGTSTPQSQDFDGDGKDDIILYFAKTNGFEPGTVVAYDIYSLDNQATPQYGRWRNPSIPDASYTAQLIYKGNEGVFIFVNSQTQFVTTGDFDGDGKADILALLEGQSTRRGSTKLVLIKPSNTTEEAKSYLIDSYFSANQPNSLLGATNIDADGKQELIFRFKNPYGVDKRHVTGLRPTASSTPTAPKFEFDSRPNFDRNYESKHANFKLADFNGDGNMDIVYEPFSTYIDIELSNGQNYLYNTSIVFGQTVDDWDVGDFNGDGLADIVCSYKKCTYYYPYPECVSRPEGCGNGTNCILYFDVYYGTGSSITGNNTVDFVKKTYSERYYDSSNGSVFAGLFTLGDYNNDGKTDLLCKVVVNQLNAPNTYNLYSFNPNGNDYLLEKIQNGFMQTTEVGYQLLTVSGDHYKRSEPSAYPLNVITAPIKVVTSVKNPDGIGGVIETTYKYANARLHRAGLGFLGFGKFEVNNTLQNAQSITEYEILTPQYVPAVKQVTGNQIAPVSGTSALLSQTIYKNSVAQHTGRGTYWLQVDNVTTKNGLTGATSTVTTKYNNEGEVRYSEANNNDEESAQTTYDLEGFNVFGAPYYVHSVKKRAGALENVSDVRNTYTVQGALLSQELIENGSLLPTPSNTYHGTTGVLWATTIEAPNLPTKTTSFKYDNFFRYAIENTNPLEQVASKTYDPRWGTVKTETDVAGLTTIYDYDGFGRAVRVTTPQGHLITTKYQWAINNGTVALPTQCYNITTIVPGKPRTTDTYDVFGRKTVAKYVNYGAVGNRQTNTETTTTYNDKGNVLETKTPVNLNSSDVAETTMYEYDKLNRPLTTSNSIGTTNYAYTYDAGKSTVSVTNPARQTASKTTDASGKVISTTDYGGTLTFVYDSRGKQTAIQLDGSVISEMKYDEKGHQTALTDKNAGTTQYQYNDYGELERQQDANGDEYTMTYDILSRLLTRTGPEGTTMNEYVPLGNNGVNQISVIKGFNGISQVYEYDKWQHITQSSETIDGIRYAKTFTYREILDYKNIPRPTNDVETVKYPSGLETKNTYSEDGYLYLVTATNNGVEQVLFDGTNGTMNGLGKWQNYRLGNGAESTITYNNWGMPVIFDAGNGNIQNLGLDWKLETGNLRLRVDFRSRHVENFDYDELNRLTNATVGTADSKDIRYYANGNIDKKTDVGTYTYDPEKINAVTSVKLPGEVVKPRPIAKEQQDIIYTAFQRPDKITEGSYEMTFMYAADYERRKTVLSQDQQEIETRLYMGDYEIRTKKDIATHIHYISGGDGICSIVVIDAASGEAKYYFPYTDHLGSILTVTNADGQVIAEQNFDAWGRKRNTDTWEYADVREVPDWLYRGFTGHEHLPEFGLINMNARLYDPALGRMLSPDNYVGSGGSQGYNRYSYANNNPLKYTDPSGNSVETAIIGAVVGGMINVAIDGVSGKINSIKDFWHSFGQGALQGAFIGAGATSPNLGFYGKLAAGVVSSHLPSYQTNFAGIDISLSPAIVYGSAGFGFGFNISGSLSFGEFSVGASLGMTGYLSSPGTGRVGLESRVNTALGYNNHDWGITVASNRFFSGETSQRTGSANLRIGEWSVSYENDGTPFQADYLLAAGDGYDSYRTAAASIGYKGLSLDMRLFTGRREYGNNCRDKPEIYGSYGYVGNPDINDYRLGILALSYKGYSIGVNNDKVRQAFQNKLAHDIIQKQAKIPNLPLAESFFEYRIKNPFTHW